MSASQLIDSKNSEEANNWFFKQRLSYYLHGAHQCLSQMGASERTTDEQLLQLTRELVGKIDQVSSGSPNK